MAEGSGCAAAVANRWLKTGATALLLAALCGCQNLAAGMPAAQVRVIDTSADSPEFDIYQGGAALVYNLGFGTVSSYVSVAPGASTINAHAAGGRLPLSTISGNFAVSGRYTVLVTRAATGAISQTVLVDRSVAAPSGMASVRVLDQMHEPVGVDLYLVRSGATAAVAQPVLTNAVAGANSDYVDVSAGAYRVVVMPSGVLPSSSTPPLYSGASAAFAPGSVRTLILLDGGAGDRRVQVISAEDYDPAAVVE